MGMKGKVALVTGASSGIGRSIALTLAREGAAVAVNYRSTADRAEQVVRHITDSGGKAVAVQGDVLTQQGCSAVVAGTTAKLKRIDICVVSPGAGWHDQPIDKLEPEAAIDDVVKEVTPLFCLMKLVLPGMYKRRWGRLIGISLNPDKGKMPPAYAYNAAKAARTAALLLAEGQAWGHGVTVNVTGPGPVSDIKSLEEAVEQCAHGSSWNKRATTSPQDIAEGVAFLCSEAGRFITGCVLPYWFT